MQRLQDRSKLSQAKRWTNQILVAKPRRYLEAKTGRSGAWWELVGAGRFDQVRFTLVDWYVIRAISGVVNDEATLDSELLTRLVRVMECVGALVAAIADLMMAVRRKSKSATARG
jgi:hypothetical protein